MLVRNGGSVGFETATSALVENNVVVLSGGYDVNGTPNIPSGVSTVGLTIDNATFSSDTLAILSGGATVTTSTGPTVFGNNLDIYAGADSFIQAINGNTLSIGGTLTANVDKFGTTAQTTGNLLRFSASGNSTLTVGGNVFLSAQAFGAGTNVDGTNAGNATGGTVIVQTGSGSTIGINGALNINVDGYGGGHNGLNGAAGNGTGGIAQILANGGSGSMVTVGGPVTVSATGRGGSSGECASCQITGGNGTGGAATGGYASISFSGAASSIDLIGSSQFDANATGGSGLNGGAATGGWVNLQAGSNGTLTAAFLGASANALGGNGQVGGAATGGRAILLR